MNNENDQPVLADNDQSINATDQNSAASNCYALPEFPLGDGSMGQDFVGKTITGVKYYGSRVEFEFDDKTVGFIPIWLIDPDPDLEAFELVSELIENKCLRLWPQIWQEGVNFNKLKTWTITLPEGPIDYPADQSEKSTDQNSVASSCYAFETSGEPPNRSVVLPLDNSGEGQTCVIKYTTLLEALKEKYPDFPEEYCELVITEGDPNEYRSKSFYLRDEFVPEIDEQTGTYTTQFYSTEEGGDFKKRVYYVIS